MTAVAGTAIANANPALKNTPRLTFITHQTPKLR